MSSKPQNSSPSSKAPKSAITPTRDENYAEWYQQVIRAADLAENSPVRGCMVIKPWGYALWENMQRVLDEMFKATGHQNAYFPLFIPLSFLQKEAAHVEGFAKECAVVTHHRLEVGPDGKLRPTGELEEPLIVRPTSETIIGEVFANWIQSYRDLPVLINQWANVVRWEKVTRLFLRTTEFLWQEGHTCHRTNEEAQEETLKMLRVYQEFAETELAMPVIPGQKTENEKFPGAVFTYTIEAMMSDGKALQAGTSHNLGQHFSKMFDIMFEDEDQTRKYVWQTSWGVSTRLVGGVIMTHGDENGLILPPRIAPIQVVIVPIFKAGNREQVVSRARELFAQLKAAGIRVHLDDRDQYSPGWKFNQYEMKGVPLRLELGPKDIEKGQCVLARRDTREKEFTPLDNLTGRVTELLRTIQKDMLERARKFRDDNTRQVADFEQFKRVIETERGFIFAPWCGSGDCELKIKEQTKATIRCLPLTETNELYPAPEGKSCIQCGASARHEVFFARSY